MDLISDIRLFDTKAINVAKSYCRFALFPESYAPAGFRRGFVCTQLADQFTYDNVAGKGRVVISAFPYSFRGYLDDQVTSFQSLHITSNVISSNRALCKGGPNTNMTLLYDVVSPQTAVINVTNNQVDMEFDNEVWFDEANENLLDLNPPSAYKPRVNYKLKSYSGTWRFICLPPERIRNNRYRNAEEYTPLGKYKISQRFNYSFVASNSNMSCTVSKSAYFFARSNRLRFIHMNGGGYPVGEGSYDVFGTRVLTQLVHRLEEFLVMKDIHVEGMKSILEYKLKDGRG